MAQQTKSNSGPRAKKSANGTAKRTNGASARAGSTRARSSAKTQARSKPRSTPAKRTRSSANGSSRSKAAKGPVASVAETAKDGAVSAGGAVRDAAKSAKVPVLVAGAGLVGLAGGAAAAARGGRKRMLGVPLPRKSTSKAVSKNLAEASRNVGRFGEGMGSLAAQVSRVSEGVNAATNGKRRSPVEVVLQGLTNRD